MPGLLLCIADGHLLDIGSDVQALHVVGVEEVVAEVVLGEVERDEEACLVWG